MNHELTSIHLVNVLYAKSKDKKKSLIKKNENKSMTKIIYKSSQYS